MSSCMSPILIALFPDFSIELNARMGFCMLSYGIICSHLSAYYFALFRTLSHTITLQHTTTPSFAQ